METSDSVSAKALAACFGSLCRDILRLSKLDAPRAHFLGQLAETVLLHSRADVIDLWLFERNHHACIDVAAIAPVRESKPPSRMPACCNGRTSPCAAARAGRVSCVRGAIESAEIVVMNGAEEANGRRPGCPALAASAVLMPFDVEGSGRGAIALRSAREGHFSPRSTDLYASVAGLVGVAIAHQSAERALQDRARELSSLYRIARFTTHLDGALDSVLRRIARALPEACPSPERVVAQLSVDGHDYRSSDRKPGARALSADVVVRKRKRGRVTIGFDDPAPELEDPLTTADVRRLLSGIARQIAIVLHRIDLRADKDLSESRLRHADRLATIGMLAAGLAHELNEPLTAVVGFAELVQNDRELPTRCRSDLDRIVAASAHARSIIRRLMALARPSPPSWDAVSLRQVVDEGLAFVAPRCAAARVRVVRQIDAALPPITADRTQLVQVVVNLALNAIQAMSEGGVLRVEARLDPIGVAIAVEDDGIGMDDEVLAKVFDPFFTTKSEGEGTGLGLVVVHGIVSVHGGSMQVQSERGRGTRMTLRLPLRPPLDAEHRGKVPRAVG